MKRYRVKYDVRMKGEAVIEAESSKEAKKKTREALTPSLKGIINDDLYHSESFEMKAES